MRNDPIQPPRDAQETIESLQRRCCAMLHHPILAALFSCWFSGGSPWPQ